MKKRIIKRKENFTVVIVPSSKARPIHFSISKGVLVFFILLFFSVVSVSIYFITRRVVFKEVLRANKILKEKTHYFAKKVDESLELVKKIHGLNTELRGLLALKERRRVLEYSGMGGPSRLEDLNISKFLFSDSTKLVDMNVNELKREAWVEFQDYRDIVKYLAKQREIAAHTPSIWPVFGRITSGFGWRVNPLLKRSEFHSALDIANLKGTPVRATADGRVVMAGWAGRLGKTVVIDHGNGYTTYYGHCDEVFVKQGEKVIKGQIIATVGATGLATGPHVHYEVRRYGKPLNPKYFLERRF